MDFTNKPPHYCVGYARGLYAGVVAVTTREDPGAAPYDLKPSIDPDADHAQGYVDGLERGVDIVGQIWRRVVSDTPEE